MSMWKKLLLVLVCGTVCCGLSASPWISFGPKRRPVTLVVTANYLSSRLLADTIHTESGQPYLLLPPVNSPDERVFVCMRDKTLRITDQDINQFINNLGVRRIVVLGDATFVPQKYIDMLDHNTPVIRIEGKDWYRIAEEVNYMLNLNNVASNYKKLREQLVTDGRLLKPMSNPPAAAPAQ